MSVPIIGFAGNAGAGKDLAAFYATCLLRGLGIDSQVLKFADALKMDMAIQYPGAPKECWWGDQEAKSQIVPGGGGKTARELMQEHGSQAKQIMGPMYWTRRLEPRICPGVVSIISDVRFQEQEVDWINAQGGVVARLTRNGGDGDHESEQTEKLTGCVVIDNPVGMSKAHLVEGVASLVYGAFAKRVSPTPGGKEYYLPRSGLVCRSLDSVHKDGSAPRALWEAMDPFDSFDTWDEHICAPAGPAYEWKGFGLP